MNGPAPSSRPNTPLPVYFVRFAYKHHADASGYHRLSEWIGEPVMLSKTMDRLGETILRVPAKLVSWYGGNFEYSRHDFVMEAQTLIHMRQHQRSIYHFMYAEKSFKMLARFRGRDGHRMAGTFHHPQSHYSWLFRSTAHLRALDHAIVVSTRQIEFMEGLVGRGRVTYIPHGIDTDYFKPGASPRQDPRTLRCLFAGIHARDFERLPAVIDGILGALSEAEFVLVSHDRRCEALARPGRVHWLRGVSDEEYLRLIQESDLLVLPLTESTTVNTVLEALACGVPVITNEGGISDYLNPACSVIFPVGDVRGMVEATVELLRNEAQRRKMGEAARAKAQEFAWPLVARQYADFYGNFS